MSSSYTNSPGVLRSFFLGSSILSSPLLWNTDRSNEEKKLIKEIQASVEKFLRTQEENFKKFDLQGAFSDDYLEALKQLGVFGLIIPEEYGGLGLSSWGYAKVIETVSYFDASTAVTLGAHSSIGLRGLIIFGTEEQKLKYLPRLATGELIAAFCLTEPNAGSDAASIQTVAERRSDGSYVLNGQKIWITNAPFAQFFTVFARTGKKRGELSCFLVERDFKGVSVGAPEDKMGIRASKTASVYFDNVVVPAANLLHQEGQGFKVAMTILNNGRTGLAGGAVGGLKRLYNEAKAYASNRKQFEKPIAEFDLIKNKLVRIRARIFAIESMVDLVSKLLDMRFEDCMLEAAALKIFATDSLWEGSNEALQIAGGNGYMRDFPFERFVRDARINRIFEGTNEILRLFLALNGFKTFSEKYSPLKSISSLYNDPIKGFGLFFDFVFGSVKKRAQPSVMELPESLKALVRDLTKIEKLAFKTFKKLSFLVGGNIVGSQIISYHISEILIWMLVLATSLVKASREQETLNIRLTEILFGEGLEIIDRELKILEKDHTTLIRKTYSLLD